MQKRILIKTGFDLKPKHKELLKKIAYKRLGVTDLPVEFKKDPSLELGFKIMLLSETVKELDISLEEAIKESIKQKELDKLKDLLKQEDFKDIGFVVNNDGVVAYAVGLSDVSYSELLRIEGTNDLAMAIDLLEDKTGIIVFADPKSIAGGTKVVSLKKQLSIKVSDALLGRHVDALGRPRDGLALKHSKNAKDMPVERIAPGVIEREPVKEPVQTGILAIDTMIPIGRGQRELIIGDRKTGKTSLTVDTILNQKGQDLICIYCAIGQKGRAVAQIYDLLKQHGALDYTIVVSATASDPASMQFIAPYSATAIAEYFLEQGKDVLVIYDDLTKHAWAYREISLLLRRPPGREAYPGDIFYLHSRLLERACKLNSQYGGGSITALPIIQTEAQDVSAYIPTNVISITDGQIYLEPDLFNKGIRPAINVGLSVSRVGSSAQTKIIKKISKQLRLDLAQYRELESFAQFGGELDKATQERLEHGKRLVELLKQPLHSPYNLAQEAVLIYAGVHGYLREIPVEKISEWKKAVLTLLETSYQKLQQKILKEKDLTPQIEDQIKHLITTSIKPFIENKEESNQPEEEPTKEHTTPNQEHRKTQK